MSTTHRKHPGLTVILAGAACLALSACSSTFGGGSPPPAQGTVAIPQGTKLVCLNGSPPPCR